MGANTHESSDANFEKDVLQSNVPILVDFWAEWYGPCRALGPKLEEIAAEMGGKMRIVKINVDENPNTPSKFGVRGIPTMILFKGGKDVEQLVGNHPKESIVNLINKHLA